MCSKFTVFSLPCWRSISCALLLLLQLRKALRVIFRKKRIALSAKLVPMYVLEKYCCTTEKANLRLYYPLSQWFATRERWGPCAPCTGGGAKHPSILHKRTAKWNHKRIPYRKIVARAPACPCLPGPQHLPQQAPRPGADKKKKMQLQQNRKQTGGRPRAARR